MQFPRASSLLAIIPLLLAACPADDVSDTDASPKCVEAESHSDLAWIQDEIFTPSCANFSACHQGTASQAGGLNLEAGRSRAAMVGVASTRYTDWTLVVPNQPAMSYLMVALGQYDGPRDSRIGTMPYNSRLLCKEKRDAIERWIQAGAPVTPPAAAP